METPGELNDESWITVEVVSAEANALMSDRLEMKTLLNIGCETRRRSRETVVRSVEEGEPLRRRAGIVLLWPEEGETAWEIGKRYAMAVDDVTGGGARALQPGQPVLLKL